VTIVFGVMLSETDEVLPERFKHKPYPIFGFLIAAGVAGAVFLGIAKLGHGTQWLNPATPVTDNSWKVTAVGNALLTTYSMAFELISLVLLVAILGALAIARGGRDKK
jgi:NADH-quinone oxidoreductase subunit J